LSGRSMNAEQGETSVSLAASNDWPSCCQNGATDGCPRLDRRRSGRQLTDEPSAGAGKLGDAARWVRRW
jgi:hypothetical protein